MPWVKFVADFDWHPPRRNGRLVIAYRAGMTQLVSQACAEAAIQARAAEPTGRGSGAGTSQAGKADEAERPKGSTDVGRRTAREDHLRGA